MPNMYIVNNNHEIFPPFNTKLNKLVRFKRVKNEKHITENHVIKNERYKFSSV